MPLAVVAVVAIMNAGLRCLLWVQLRPLLLARAGQAELALTMEILEEPQLLVL
jgi:hypothetical protein